MKLILNLNYCNYFNQTVGSLPNSIQNLTFDYEFNLPIEKIPSELKTLSIDEYSPNTKTIFESVLELNPNIKIIEIYS